MTDWLHGKRIAGALLLSFGAALSQPTASAETALLDFTPDEVRKILQHGPWPPPPARDAGNARADDPRAIDLGRRLFFDRRLSIDGTMSCASC